MNLRQSMTRAFLLIILFYTANLQAKPGDVWHSGKQFHAPVAGAPVRQPDNSTDDNAWDYGFRMAKGYNDGKWSHMDAGPFQPFPLADEFGPSVFGEADSGADLNRWWIPFPPPEGKQFVGRMLYAEGAAEAGPAKFLAKQVHLSTDDSAPIDGIVSLRWRAPVNGVFNILVQVENRMDVDDKAQRDPYYHLVVNGARLNEGLLEGFGTQAKHQYQGVSLQQGDTVEICASTGSVAFPFALLAAEVTIKQVPQSLAQSLPEQLAAQRDADDQGPEPIPEVDAAHPYFASMNKAAGWIQQNFGPEAIGLPISFVYNGKPMFRSPHYGHPLPANALQGWKQKRTWQQLDEFRLQKTLTYTDLKTDLQVRLEIIQYHDFPTVEWVVYFKNLGEQPTPVIENIQAINLLLNAEDWLLHHNAGSWPGAASYAPLATPLAKGRRLQLSAFGGRPSNTDMPYFNLEQDQEGVILVVGWPGQWETVLHRTSGPALNIQSGQQQTHLRLQPGEEIRTPLIVLQFRSGGDWIDGQNVWRRWMIAHNLPRPNGQPVPPMFSGQTGYFMDWMYKATEENQKQYIDRFLSLGIDIDHWWMDTGWYTPLWEPVPERFPNGIKAISEHAHQKNLKTILWFEPERITPKSWIDENHSDWVLRATTTTQGLLNLGNQQALQWVTDHISRILSENQVDVYRSDFNMDPLDHWRQSDAPDRQGITENHFVTGYLAFWDGLLERKPGLMIDSCASGGRRNDLETLRRSVPLWKSDFAIQPEGMQSQTYGLSMWIPYFGNAGGQIDEYLFRSNMYPAITKGAWEDRTPTRDIRDDKLDYELLRKLIQQWRQVSPNYSGDFYPLTPFSLETKNVWMAWQFDRPEKGAGFVQAFRRPGKNSPAKLSIQLRGLDSTASYTVENLDNGSKQKFSGQQLITGGLDVKLPSSPGAAIFVYTRDCKPNHRDVR